MAAEATKGKQLCRLTYTHEAMIDLILQEPTVTVSELAEIFNYSSGWISRVVSSDSFKARLAERKATLIDVHVARTLNERFESVAIHAVEIIGKKLDAEENANYAIDALGLATQALGLTKARI
jgi:DNA-binding MarR family transcriptional regulator